MKETKDKILDAAEKLFAANGFAGTSLRTIIKEAGVNTASVHYHFGSKEALIEAVLYRRVAPFNNERIRLLDLLEAKYPTGPLPLAEVVRTFLEPVIKAHAGLPDGKRANHARSFPRLMGRAITEPDVSVGDFFHKLFGEVFKRFFAAFSRALPDQSPEEVRWRMHLMIGAMVSTIAVPAFHHDVEKMSPRASEPDLTLRRLVAFISAGMQAPVAQTDRKDNN